MRKRYLGFSVFVIVILMLMTFAEAKVMAYDGDNGKNEEKLLSDVRDDGKGSADDVGSDVNNDEEGLLANVDNVGGDEVDEAKVSADKVEGNGVGDNKDGLVDSLINDFKSWVGFFNSIFVFGKNKVSGYSITGNAVNNPWRPRVNPKLKAPVNYLIGYILSMDKNKIHLPDNEASIIKQVKLVSVHGLETPRQLESFYANHIETSVGAEKDMISHALSKERLIFYRPRIGKPELVPKDVELMEAIGNYYDVMNRLRIAEMAVVESIIMANAYLFNDAIVSNGDSSLLFNGISVNSNNPFAEELSAHMNKIRDNLRFDYDKLNRQTADLFENTILPLEKEKHRIEVELKCGAVPQDEIESMIKRRIEIIGLIDDLKAVGAQWTRGMYFKDEFNIQTWPDVSSISPSSSLCLSSPEARLTNIGARFHGSIINGMRRQFENNKISHIKFLNSVQDAIIAFNNPNTGFSDMREKLSKILGKLPAHPLFDVQNGEDLRDIMDANQYLVNSYNSMKTIERNEKNAEFWFNLGMMAGLVFAGGFIVGSLALINAGYVSSTALEISVITLGIAIVAADVYYTRESVREAVDTCNEAFDVWDKQVWMTNNEQQMPDFGPNVNYDYKACLIASLLAGFQITSLSSPLFVREFLNSESRVVRRLEDILSARRSSREVTTLFKGLSESKLLTRITVVKSNTLTAADRKMLAEHLLSHYKGDVADDIKKSLSRFSFKDPRDWNADEIKEFLNLGGVKQDVALSFIAESKARDLASGRDLVLSSIKVGMRKINDGSEGANILRPTLVGQLHAADTKLARIYPMLPGSVKGKKVLEITMFAVDLDPADIKAPLKLMRDSLKGVIDNGYEDSVLVFNFKDEHAIFYNTVFNRQGVGQRLNYEIVRGAGKREVKILDDELSKDIDRLLGLEKPGKKVLRDIPVSTLIPGYRGNSGPIETEIAVNVFAITDPRGALALLERRLAEVR